MIPCAYLRVFQPLEVFPPEERDRWERYILSGGQPRPLRPVYREQRTESGGRIGLIAAVEGDGADVHLVEGSYFVCPWRTRLRILASLLSLRESTAPEVVEAFVPEAEARRAAKELARLRRRDPSAVPFMLQSPWHVPVRWFVLFEDRERKIVERDAGGFRLFYRAPITEARKRAERALAVLRRAELEPVADLVQDLARWLSAFDRRSFAELDYATVSDLFTWDELDNDHSARDLHQALAALEEGDLARSAELYQSVAARWAEVRSQESLN